MKNALQTAEGFKATQRSGSVIVKIALPLGMMLGLGKVGQATLQGGCNLKPLFVGELLA